MAILELPKKMVYWKINLGPGNDITSLSKEVVASFTITYSLNAPTVAEIVIHSNSYIEDVFTNNQVIEIYCGYENAALVEMFKGKIMKLPSGSAQEQLTYTVKAYGNEIKMATQSKNKVYSGYTKTAIVASIMQQNGIIPSVQIADVAPLKATEIPMQKGKTDYEFLVECAARWNCFVWFSNTTGVLTGVFMDKSTAFTMGDSDRVRSPGDFLPTYYLGYRTNSARNNVARLKWSFKSPKGGGNGNPSYTASNEGGSTEEDRMYTVEYQGKRWKLKSKFIDAGNGSGKNYISYFLSIANSKVAQAETTLHYYFQQMPSVRTRGYNNVTGSGQNVDIEVELNEGDPFLRPPRTIDLKHGSEDPKAISADLPNFLFNDTVPTDFRLYEVETSLSDKGLITKLKMYKK